MNFLNVTGINGDVNVAEVDVTQTIMLGDAFGLEQTFQRGRRRFVPFAGWPVGAEVPRHIGSEI